MISEERLRKGFEELNKKKVLKVTIDEDVAKYLNDLCCFHESELLLQQDRIKSKILLDAIESELDTVRRIQDLLQCFHEVDA